MLYTIEAEFKIRKSVPLHTTVTIQCKVMAPDTASHVCVAKQILCLLMQFCFHTC